MKKKSGFLGKPFMALLAVIALAGLMFASCGGGSYTIKYEVSGTASSATVAYSNESGGAASETVSIPWTKTITVPNSTVAVACSVAVSGSGTLSGKIYVDGKEKASGSGAVFTMTANL
ncbi:MAG: hypothetical protein LBQ94_01225 [Treponema sp.]|jgi:hypothetical protein|nr:hypothetical protein [Treponema sp.]